MFTELAQDNLEEVTQSDKPTIVQYSAGWCGNCRIMKPKFKRLANDNEAYNFVLVDAEKFPNSRKLAEVNNLPTFAAFVDGKLLGQVQTNKEESLKQFINETTNH
ncbi:MAG: thioredoxin family protein [Cyclobacteriaceae bacterium]